MGMLARVEHYGTSPGIGYYHSDGNGNVTAILAPDGQSLLAAYLFDPYGRTLQSSGTWASGNVYRFSSKEYLGNAGLYYYGFRFYAPELQRWVNRDPIEEAGGINLYGFVGNGPVGAVDTFGEWKWWHKYGSSGPNAFELWSGLYSAPTWVDADGEFHYDIPPSQRREAYIPDDLTDTDNIRLYSHDLGGCSGADWAKKVGWSVPKGVVITATMIPLGPGEVGAGALAAGRGWRLSKNWKPKLITSPSARSGCESIATQIKNLIGGEIKRIAPKEGVYLGPYRGEDMRWAYHEVVVKDGVVYDAFTGSKGLPIDQFKKLWKHWEDIDFGF